MTGLGVALGADHRRLAARARPVPQGLRPIQHRCADPARRHLHRHRLAGRRAALGHRRQQGRGRHRSVPGRCLLAWVSTASTATAYLEIVGQMVLAGLGMGLTTAPATEAIMGVVPKGKAGIGSAVNDATRELGATLGVAIIGSVYASLCASGIRDAAGSLPPPALDAASDSIGAALTVAGQLGPAGRRCSKPPRPRSSTASGSAASSPPASSSPAPSSPPATCPPAPPLPPHPNPSLSLHPPSKPQAPRSPQAYPAAVGIEKPPPQPRQRAEALRSAQHVLQPA
jgi:hypothetical protein